MAGQEKLHSAFLSHQTVAISLCFIWESGAPSLCILLRPTDQEKQKDEP
jgi:hypothetical protein